MIPALDKPIRRPFGRRVTTLVALVCVTVTSALPGLKKAAATQRYAGKATFAPEKAIAALVRADSPQHVHKARHNMSIAACVSGAPHSLVDPRLLSHWVAAFAPLRDPVLRLDVLLHLDGASHPAQLLRGVAEALQAVSLELYNVPASNASLSKVKKIPTGMRFASTLDAQLRKTHGNVSDLKCNGPSRCVKAGDKECMTTGYEQAVKWRGCLRDIERREHHAGAYNFVLRLRPDLEFAAEFPKASEWLRLRRDVVMTLVANSVSQTRLIGSVAPRISFLDDGLALLPRRAATAYFGVADEFEACILLDPPGAGMGRWRWPEYRVILALSQVQPPLSFAEFPSTQPGWAIIDDEGRGNLVRRKGLATVWGGARHPAHPLLSIDLPTSSFSPDALLPVAVAHGHG